MNGLNKKGAWKRIGLLIGVSYFVIVALLAIFVYNIPALYQNLNDQRVSEIKNEITYALNADSPNTQMTELMQIVTDNTVDLVVIDEAGTVFSTMEITDFTTLQNNANEKALSYHAAYPYTNTSGHEYKIWIAIYKLEPQTLFVITMTFIVGGITILALLIAVLVALMFRRLFAPIKRLRDNIFKLKEYRLNEVSTIDRETEFDVLSEELSEFTEDLQGKMESFGVKYSLLETELQENREEKIYKEELVSALAHDLKTPFNISLFQLEKIEKMAGNYPELLSEIGELKNRNERILDDINELLVIIKSEHSKEYTQIELIDVTIIIRDMLRLFTPILEERNIQYYVDMPRNLNIYANELAIQQLVHNIISNVCQYTDADGSFEFSIYEENGFVHFEAYNDKTDRSMIDFAHVFDLFYTVQTTSHNTGSGIGMYTMKRMVERYSGSITFAPSENGVQLSIALPVGKIGDTHE